MTTPQDQALHEARDSPFSLDSNSDVIGYANEKVKQMEAAQLLEEQPATDKP